MENVQLWLFDYSRAETNFIGHAKCQPNQQKSVPVYNWNPLEWLWVRRIWKKNKVEIAVGE